MVEISKEQALANLKLSPEMTKKVKGIRDVLKQREDYFRKFEVGGQWMELHSKKELTEKEWGQLIIDVVTAMEKEKAEQQAKDLLAETVCPCCGRAYDGKDIK